MKERGSEIRRFAIHEAFKRRPADCKATVVAAFTCIKTARETEVRDPHAQELIQEAVACSDVSMQDPLRR